ncbi:kinase-like domain-containing protein [Podospora aff. communis PSN243]|uniref:Kinase-like domain-containing protein n=1 Tax=Podospora aff. communis PSN243 TaxID=3040156 RepID=A0AAV9G7R0_9PEZI|nr:kinase-like domain-containing protein [Podospora aff. communis PSN243]
MYSPASEAPRPGTPPHHPIFGVKLPISHIEAIFAAIYPHRTLLSVSQLPSGRSFNNRIYFLSIARSNETSGASPGAPGDVLQLVLKVNGRFFGPDKIQNEVSCLRILEQYCPDVPVPRIIAWSENGRTIAMPSSDEDYGTRQDVPIPLGDNSTLHPGWILMTRMPGEPISSLTLDGPAMSSIGAQLADMVASWRRNIPHTSNCGNLLFSSSSLADPSNVDIDLGHEDARPSGPTDAFIVRGLLGDGIAPGLPISSTLDLHRIRLEHKLQELNTNTTYAPNRDLVPTLSEFVLHTLPRLFPANHNSSSFIFTHFDLSPRNTLITTSPGLNGGPPVPKITGLIDLEFSGFFPPLDEFVNDYVDNGGDWPDEMYAAYLDRLEALAMPTPRKGMHEREWRVQHHLGVLLDNIAPWWLPGGFDGRQVEEKLKESREMVGISLRVLGEDSMG